MSKKLDIMGLVSKMMLYSIGDVKDWQALKHGRFAKNKHAFNLDDALDEINDIVNFHLKSNNKTIKFIFERNFSKDIDKNEVFVELVKIEQI